MPPRISSLIFSQAFTQDALRRRASPEKSGAVNCTIQSEGSHSLSSYGASPPSVTSLSQLGSLAAVGSSDGLVLVFRREFPRSHLLPILRLELPALGERNCVLRDVNGRTQIDPNANGANEKLSSVDSHRRIFGVTAVHLLQIDTNNPNRATALFVCDEAGRLFLYRRILYANFVGCNSANIEGDDDLSCGYVSTFKYSNYERISENWLLLDVPSLNEPTESRKEPITCLTAWRCDRPSATPAAATAAVAAAVAAASDVFIFTGDSSGIVCRTRVLLSRKFQSKNSVVTQGLNLLWEVKIIESPRCMLNCSETVGHGHDDKNHFPAGGIRALHMCGGVEGHLVVSATIRNVVVAKPMHRLPLPPGSINLIGSKSHNGVYVAVSAWIPFDVGSCTSSTAANRHNERFKIFAPRPGGRIWVADGSGTVEATLRLSGVGSGGGTDGASKNRPSLSSLAFIAPRLFICWNQLDQMTESNEHSSMNGGDSTSDGHQFIIALGEVGSSSLVQQWRLPGRLIGVAVDEKSSQCLVAHYVADEVNNAMYNCSDGFEAFTMTTLFVSSSPMYLIKSLGSPIEAKILAQRPITSIRRNRFSIAARGRTLRCCSCRFDADAKCWFAAVASFCLNFASVPLVLTEWNANLTPVLLEVQKPQVTAGSVEAARACLRLLMPITRIALLLREHTDYHTLVEKSVCVGMSRYSRESKRCMTMRCWDGGEICGIERCCFISPLWLNLMKLYTLTVGKVESLVSRATIPPSLPLHNFPLAATRWTDKDSKSALTVVLNEITIRKPPISSKTIRGTMKRSPLLYGDAITRSKASHLLMSPNLMTLPDIAVLAKSLVSLLGLILLLHPVVMPRQELLKSVCHLREFLRRRRRLWSTTAGSPFRDSACAADRHRLSTTRPTAASTPSTATPLSSHSAQTCLTGGALNCAPSPSIWYLGGNDMSIETSAQCSVPEMNHEMGVTNFPLRTQCLMDLGFRGEHARPMQSQHADPNSLLLAQALESGQRGAAVAAEAAVTVAATAAAAAAAAGAHVSSLSGFLQHDSIVQLEGDVQEDDMPDSDVYVVADGISIIPLTDELKRAAAETDCRSSMKLRHVLNRVDRNGVSAVAYGCSNGNKRPLGSATMKNFCGEYIPLLETGRTVDDDLTRVRVVGSTRHERTYSLNVSDSDHNGGCGKDSAVCICGGAFIPTTERDLIHEVPLETSSPGDCDQFRCKTTTLNVYSRENKNGSLLGDKSARSKIEAHAVAKFTCAPSGGDSAAFTSGGRGVIALRGSNMQLLDDSCPRVDTHSVAFSSMEQQWVIMAAAHLFVLVCLGCCTSDAMTNSDDTCDSIGIGTGKSFLRVPDIKFVSASSPFTLLKNLKILSEVQPAASSDETAMKTTHAWLASGNPSMDEAVAISYCRCFFGPWIGNAFNACESTKDGYCQWTVFENVLRSLFIAANLRGWTSLCKRFAEWRSALYITAKANGYAMWFPHNCKTTEIGFDDTSLLSSEYGLDPLDTPISKSGGTPGTVDPFALHCSLYQLTHKYVHACETMKEVAPRFPTLALCRGTVYNANFWRSHVEHPLIVSSAIFKSRKRKTSCIQATVRSHEFDDYNSVGGAAFSAAEAGLANPECSMELARRMADAFPVVAPANVVDWILVASALVEPPTPRNHSSHEGVDDVCVCLLDQDVRSTFHPAISRGRVSNSAINSRTETGGGDKFAAVGCDGAVVRLSKGCVRLLNNYLLMVLPRTDNMAGREQLLAMATSTSYLLLFNDVRPVANQLVHQHCCGEIGMFDVAAPNLAHRKALQKCYKQDEKIMSRQEILPQHPPTSGRNANMANCEVPFEGKSLFITKIKSSRPHDGLSITNAEDGIQTKAGVPACASPLNLRSITVEELVLLMCEARENVPYTVVRRSAYGVPSQELLLHVRSRGMLHQDANDVRKISLSEWLRWWSILDCALNIRYSSVVCHALTAHILPVLSNLNWRRLQKEQANELMNALQCCATVIISGLVQTSSHPEDWCYYEGSSNGAEGLWGACLRWPCCSDLKAHRSLLDSCVQTSSLSVINVAAKCMMLLHDCIAHCYESLVGLNQDCRFGSRGLLTWLARASIHPGIISWRQRSYIGATAENSDCISGERVGAEDEDLSAAHFRTGSDSPRIGAKGNNDDDGDEVVNNADQRGNAVYLSASEANGICVCGSATGGWGGSFHVEDVRSLLHLRNLNAAKDIPFPDINHLHPPSTIFRHTELSQRNFTDQGFPSRTPSSELVVRDNLVDGNGSRLHICSSIYSHAQSPMDSNDIRGTQEHDCVCCCRTIAVPPSACRLIVLDVLKLLTTELYRNGIEIPGCVVQVLLMREVAMSVITAWYKVTASKKGYTDILQPVVGDTGCSFGSLAPYAREFAVSMEDMWNVSSLTSATVLYKPRRSWWSCKPFSNGAADRRSMYWGISDREGGIRSDGADSTVEPCVQQNEKVDLQCAATLEALQTIKRKYYLPKHQNDNHADESRTIVNNNG